MKKLLLINPFGIGDVLFTTPVIKAIKDNQPDSIIGYWCNERVKDILKNNSNIDKIFALSRGDIKKIYRKSRLKGIYKFLSLLYSIRKERFNILLDFSLDHRYSLISKLLGIKKRIGFNYKNRARFLTHKIDIDGYDSKYVVEYYLDLLKLIDIKPKTYHLDLYISKENKIKSKNILAKLGIDEKDLIIGILPGAGRSWGKDASFKQWPAIRFAQLADRIINGLGAKLVILGDELERPIAEMIVNTMQNKTIDLVRKTSLEELASIISNLCILVTNDGGPLHIAVAVGVKTVSIFGPVDEKVYGPYPPSENHIVIKKDLSCRPCYKSFRFLGCFNNRRCIQDITVDEVYSAVKRLI